MSDTSSIHGRSVPATGAPDRVLFQLEERYAHLCAEMSVLEGRLRELRTAADLCPLCGGAGQRWTRGGLYGEIQQRPCSCQSG
jgi:hypothetical protein